MNPMKYVSTISTLFLAVTVCCVPAFSDTLLLKSGKSVEGKIIEETDTYVTIEYASIPLKYWKDEVQKITKSSSAAQPITSQPTSQPSSRAGTVKIVDITIKEDPKEEIAAFARMLEEKRIEAGSALSEVKSKIEGDITRDGRISDTNRQFFRESLEIARNKVNQMKSIRTPAACKDLRDYALRVAEAELEQFASALSSLNTYADLMTYWKDYPKEKFVELKKKYDAERQRIFSIYKIELPEV
jgi:hypothetical protein